MESRMKLHWNVGLGTNNLKREQDGYKLVDAALQGLAASWIFQNIILSPYKTYPGRLACIIVRLESSDRPLLENDEYQQYLLM